MMKTPVTAPAYTRPVVYCPNTSAPTAIANRPSAMPFFMPVLRRMADDGKARKKYDR